MSAELLTPAELSEVNQYQNECPELTKLLRAYESLVQQVATERNAREQAEKDAAQHKLEAVSLFDALNDATTSNEVGLKQLQQAERERDTALAGRDAWHKSSDEHYDQLQKALARVKELEGNLQGMTDDRDGHYDLRMDAETALASARATIGRVAEYVGYLELDIAAARKNREPQTGMLVPYHGAFCSAPISTIKDLERFARSMRELLTSHPSPAPVAERPNDGRSGRCGMRLSGNEWCVLDHGHGGECVAPLPVPNAHKVAAPCAGCAELRTKLERARKILSSKRVLNPCSQAARVLEALR